MKKVLILLIIVTMTIVAICGCGQQKKEENINQDIIEKENVAIEEKLDPVDSNSIITPPEFEEIEIEDPLNRIWRLGEFETPDISIEVEEIVVNEKDNVKSKIGITKYNYDVKKIKERLSEIPFVKDNYELAYNVYETVQSNPENLSEKSYKYSETIGAQLKSTADGFYVDFEFIFNGNTNYSDGYDQFQIMFQSLDFKENYQDDIFSIMANVFPKEIAEYLVYANDKDGEIPKDFEPDVKNLYDCMQDDNFEYTFSREISEDCIIFEFGVTGIKNSDNYLFYCGNYEPKLDNMKYQPQEFFKDSLGGNDVSNNPTQVFDKLFQVETNKYEKTRLGYFDEERVLNQLEDSQKYEDEIKFYSYSRSYSVEDNGAESYFYSIDADTILKDDVKKLNTPTVYVDYTVKEKEGVIDDVLFIVQYIAETDTVLKRGTFEYMMEQVNSIDLKKEISDLYNTMLKQISLFDVDVSDYTEEDFEYPELAELSKDEIKDTDPDILERMFKGSAGMDIDTTITILEKEYDCSVNVGIADVSYGCFSITVEPLEEVE